MAYKIFTFLIFAFLLEDMSSEAIDLLPCTDNPTAADFQTARRLIQQSTPPGYTFVDVDPEVTTGRNLHRWIARFTRNDGTYEYGCEYIVSVKQNFKRYCPAGSEVPNIRVRRIPNRNEIIVEYLVNCYCTNVSRRRRRAFLFFKNHDPVCNISGYTKERSICYKI